MWDVNDCRHASPGTLRSNRWMSNGRKPQGRHITKMARLARVSRREMNEYLLLGKAT